MDRSVAARGWRKDEQAIFRGFLGQSNYSVIL
jgi:hypothetical protein